MEQKPSEITAALDEFLGPYLFPDKGDGSDPRLCPNCGTGRLALRGGKFGPFIACSNYPDCKFTRKFAQPGGHGEADNGPETLGTDPDSGLEVTRRSGRFGPYIQLGEGKEAKRSSIPKDIPAEDFDLDYALRLLSLPRDVGVHPESGKPIVAGLGRYGPYVTDGTTNATLPKTVEPDALTAEEAVALIDARAAKGPAKGKKKAVPKKKAPAKKAKE